MDYERYMEWNFEGGKLPEEFDRIKFKSLGKLEEVQKAWPWNSTSSGISSAGGMSALSQSRCDSPRT